MLTPVQTNPLEIIEENRKGGDGWHPFPHLVHPMGY